MDYNKMKKDELIKALKEKDAAIAGFEETNRQLVKDNDEFSAKINGLERDCEGMTEECNNLRNKVNGLTDDYNNAVKERNAFANPAFGRFRLTVTSQEGGNTDGAFAPTSLVFSDSPLAFTAVTA